MKIQCPKCGSDDVEILPQLGEADPYDCTCNTCGHNWDPSKAREDGQRVEESDESLEEE